MELLLTEASKRLPERWLSALVLPGVLYLAVIGLGLLFAAGTPWTFEAASDELSQWAESPTQLAAIVVALAVGAAVVGLAAQACGTAIERGSLAADWPGWITPFRQLAGRLTEARRDRWDGAKRRYDQRRVEAAEQPARKGETEPSDPLASARRPLEAISRERPDRPTWMGDRLQSVAHSMERDYEIDLATVWPYVWLAMPDTVRTELTTARASLTRATTLAGWGVLYVVAGLLWWPTVPLGVGVLVVAWRRARTATDSYATLLEAAVRLHTVDVVRQLGTDHPGPLTKEAGRELTLLLQGQAELIPHTRQ